MSAYLSSSFFLYGNARNPSEFFSALFSGKSQLSDLREAYLPPDFPRIVGSVIAPERLGLNSGPDYLHAVTSRFDKVLDILFAEFAETLRAAGPIDWVFASKSNDAQFDFNYTLAQQTQRERFGNEAYRQAIAERLEKQGCRVDLRRIQILDAACASGHVACGLAARLFRAKRSERALVLALDLVSLERLWLLTALGAAAKLEEKEAPSGPFSLERKGFFTADGAAIALLESESAQNRRSDCASRIVDFYQNADAETLTAGSKNGVRAEACMAVLKSKHQIDAIKVHGTGTELNDASECAALKRLFADRPPLAISLKGQIGHSLTASSLFELIIVDEIFRREMVPGIQHLRSPDPACALDFAQDSCAFSGHKVLLNAFGFGGHNACLVQERVAT